MAALPCTAGQQNLRSRTASQVAAHGIFHVYSLTTRKQVLAGSWQQAAGAGASHQHLFAGGQQPRTSSAMATIALMRLYPVWVLTLPCWCLQNDEPEENIRQAETAVRFLWRFLLMPLLFTLIGTLIEFSTLQSTTIQKACAIVFAGGACYVESHYVSQRHACRS